MVRRRAAVLALLAVVACKKRHDEGAACEAHEDCRSELICHEHRCSVSPELYKQMADQSGVAVVKERPPNPAVPGAVRVRWARGTRFAFAICGDNERLVGGWCTPPGDGGDDAEFVAGEATDYGEHDTIGARWRCRLLGTSKIVVTAFAMCQLVAPSP